MLKVRPWQEAILEERLLQETTTSKDPLPSNSQLICLTQIKLRVSSRIGKDMGCFWIRRKLEIILLESLNKFIAYDY